MKSTLGKFLPFIFTIVLLITIGDILLAYRNLFLLKNNNDLIQHTHEVKSEIKTILSLVVDAETGERGFLLSGDEKFLDPYKQALPSIDEHIRNVKNLANDNELQKDNITMLEKQVKERLKYLETGISLRKQDGYDSTTSFTVVKKGREVMEEVRKTVSTMDKEEDRLLTLRKKQLENSRSIVYATTAIGGIISLLFLAAAMYLTRHELVRRDQIKYVTEKNERRFRSLIEKGHDAIAVADENGVISYVSPSVTKILGYTPKEFMSINGLDRLHPDESAELMKWYKKVIKKPGSSATIQHRYLHKNKKWVWIESTITNLLKDGNVKALVSNFHNITEQLEATNALKASEERLRLAIEAGKIGVWDWNIPTGTLTWSDKVFEIHGVNPKNFEVTFENFQKLIHPEDKEKAITAINDALKQNKPFITEFRIVTPQNQERWISTSAVIFRDKKGKPSRMLGATLDITDQKKLDQDKNDFISIAAHELKTPVTSLKAYAEVLQRRFIKSGDDQSALHLGKMNAQLDRLTNLISDLLDATKIDGGKLYMHEEEFDFDNLVHEMVEEMQRTTEKHTIKIEGSSKMNIFADKERTGQVLINLISNAIKYSPVSKSIKVEVSSKKQSVQVCVQDFGVGIPKEKQSKLFERFYRVSGPKESTFPGLGLGLYISSEIIKRQGGKIWVESTEGKGSTFCFTLPIKKST